MFSATDSTTARARPGSSSSLGSRGRFARSHKQGQRAKGKGSADIQPNADAGNLTGVASYDQGEWSVIFKRPLKAESAAPFDWPALAWTVGGFILFILTLRLLGWVLAAALLFWFVARGFGNRSPLTSLAVGLTVSSLAYIGFDMGLGLNLPSGILGGAF